jgi:serine/threonine protein phosphatase PrpC
VTEPAIPSAPLERGALREPRLYLGTADAEFDVFAAGPGHVGAATIADAAKPGPNEDSAAIIPVNDDYLVLAVADGVGGLAGAQKASNLAVLEIRKAIRAVEQPSSRGLRTAILDGIEAANLAILGMGNGGASTLALAEVGPDYVRTYHVGDSILLLCGQRGRVKLQTTPHSPVGFAMEAGLINEQEALAHEELNLIFNVLGSADMRIEIGSEQPIAARDTLLLASDGLADNLLQLEIVAAIRKGPIDQALRTVTHLAQTRMRSPQTGTPSKPDDFTALIFRRNAGRRKRRQRAATT